MLSTIIEEGDVMEFLLLPIQIDHFAILMQGEGGRHEFWCPGKERHDEFRPSASPSLPTSHQDSCLCIRLGGGFLTALLGSPTPSPEPVILHMSILYKREHHQLIDDLHSP